MVSSLFYFLIFDSMNSPSEKLFWATEWFEKIKVDIITSQSGIRNIYLNLKGKPGKSSGLTKLHSSDPYMLNSFSQLDEYFSFRRKNFELPLELIGTDFQKMVWSELQKIKYGKTITYRELAIRLGNEKSIRAVGRANASNPIPIVVPCHRVIGADDRLVGYGGGLEVKEKLLELEGSRSLELFN